MKYLILSIALLAAPVMAEPHVTVFHACGRLIVTEYEGPAGADVIFRRVWLDSQEVRDSLAAAVEASAPERIIGVDITGLLYQLYGFRCPGST